MIHPLALLQKYTRRDTRAHSSVPTRIHARLYYAGHQTAILLHHRCRAAAAHTRRRRWFTRATSACGNGHGQGHGWVGLGHSKVNCSVVRIVVAVRLMCMVGVMSAVVFLVIKWIFKARSRQRKTLPLAFGPSLPPYTHTSTHIHRHTHTQTPTHHIKKHPCLGRCTHSNGCGFVSSWSEVSCCSSER